MSTLVDNWKAAYPSSSLRDLVARHPVAVFLIMLFHSAYNSAASLGEQKFTGEIISGPALLYAVEALVVLAAVVTAFTRGRLGNEPERPTPPTEEGKTAAQLRWQ